jgi:RsiW-degrading membrane proteinase PrsW (M82 family)
MTLSPLIFAIIGGMAPPLIWLWFWRKEDRVAPEPRKIIFFVFLAGILVVPLVLPLEHAVLKAYGGGFTTVILWAAIEEIAKLVAAYLGALTTRYADEPIDMVIYLITAALGFAAIENVLFLLGPLAEGRTLLGAITGNMRFIGATLLHTATSAIIGLGLAFSFYRHRRTKKRFLIGGVILAIILHTLFNFSIMQTNGNSIFMVFGAVWAVVIGLIFTLERVKRLRGVRVQ